MKFLFDNTLPPKVAKALNVLVQPEHEIRHLKEHSSGASIEDEDWIKGLSPEDQSIIVTADLRTERNPYAIRAWNQADRPVMILKSGWIDMPFWRQMNILTKSFRKIIEAVQRIGTDHPLVLTTSGKVDRLKMPSAER